MRFGSVERGGPPPQRTHAEATAEGVKCDEYTGPACHHPRTRSGINGATPFSHCPLFDIIRDLCPDMMHIIVNFFLHWLPVLSGSRRPTVGRFKPPRDSASDADKKAYADELARLKRAQMACDLLTLTEADRVKVDTRMFDLALCPKYVKKSHVPFGTNSGGKKPKAADWYNHALHYHACIMCSF